jgi:hypothetical protein
MAVIIRNFFNDLHLFFFILRKGSSCFLRRANAATVTPLHVRIRLLDFAGSFGGATVIGVLSTAASLPIARHNGRVSFHF